MSDTAGSNVADFIASLSDDQLVEDTRVLMDLMTGISGHEPQSWNVGTIGFDTYHYKYASGREGDCQVLGFYPRKGKITVYLMDGTARHADLLAGLGKHTTSRVCLYFKALSDIDLAVLEEILRESYRFLKAHDGQVQRVQ